MTIEKRVLVGVAAMGALVALASPAVIADNEKPPKAAVEHLNRNLATPSPDGGGVVDPTKDQGAALALRDPETGFVLRDPATGLPLFARDENGNLKLFRAQEVPAEQRAAQAKMDERMIRAGKGDVKAQKELEEEAEKTRKAVRERPNGK